MAECSAQDLMEASACFACLDEKQLMAVNAQLLCEILQISNPMATCDPVELMEDGACFACLDTRQLAIIQTQLLCEILSAGGGGGSSCIFGGTADPVAAPACTYAIYYRTDTGGVWLWLPATAEWAQLIGG